jgi:hypothetical protein
MIAHFTLTALPEPLQDNRLRKAGDADDDSRDGRQDQRHMKRDVSGYWRGQSQKRGSGTHRATYGFGRLRETTLQPG